ncbi:MAG TPA: DNA cytosine methyltransferase [Holophaga sp.]|nr:DNA cytosine methyltransferase [Holophaga sp.]HPS68667.1 DNA cytosine methyltransferase [Holophaga sp.]
MRVLELFSGLGGWRYALEGLGGVVAAYDISPGANETYALNHGSRPIARELASLPPDRLAAHRADLWVLSPPCQPYCRMGHRQGLEDRRSRAFLNLLEILPAAPPEHLVLENVTGFLGSDAHDLLARTLGPLGFRWKEYQLCPTRFGIPNQRPRAFIAASRQPLRELVLPEREPGALAAYLDPEEDPRLYLDPATLARHKPGLDLVTREERRTACFIGGYGQRFVGSGSFLRTERGVRRFSPTEVARFMGLPPAFQFPEQLGLEQRYKLLGNSLSIPVARWVLGAVLPQPGNGRAASSEAGSNGMGRPSR